MQNGRVLATSSGRQVIPSPCFIQIIEWYEEYAEEFFQTHTELGESLEIALALEQEVKQFEDSTQVSSVYYYFYPCKADQ